MFQCEGDRFDDRPAVIDIFVVASIVCHIEWVKLPMFDDRADTSVPEVDLSIRDLAGLKKPYGWFVH
jgi:hypothetical protein